MQNCIKVQEDSYYLKRIIVTVGIERKEIQINANNYKTHNRMFTFIRCLDGLDRI